MILTCECGQKMKVPESSMGKVFKCVRCANKLKVSDSNIRPLRDTIYPGIKKEAGTSQPPERIGNLLLKDDYITKEHLEQALAYQKKNGGKVYEILIELGYLSPNDLHSFLSKQPGIPTIDLKNFSISKHVVEMIPREVAVEHAVVPIDQLGRLLTVAMANPLDTAPIAALEQITGLKVKAMLCKIDDLNTAIDAYYPMAKNEKETEDAAMAMFSGIMASTASDIPPEVPSKPFVETVAPQADKILLADKVAGFHGFAVVPEFQHRLAERVQNNGVGIRAILDLVSDDPVMCAMLLQTVNSATFGMSGRIGSVSLAVLMLGAEGTSKVATACSNPTFPDRSRLIDRARRCAVFAEALADTSKKVGLDIAYTSGLIHELGRFVMLELEPEGFSKIDDSLWGKQLVQQEHETFDLSHIDINGELCNQWYLPDTLYQILTHYPEPQNAGEMRPLASLIHLANALAAKDSSVLQQESCIAALKYLGISAEQAVKAASDALAVRR